MNIIIIGSGPAGITAASTIRKMDSSVKITLITQDQYTYYARPRLPEIIAGKISIKDAIIHKSEWYETNDIQLLLNTKVTAVDTKNKVVELNSKTIPYSKLILATGASANTPPIPGIASKNIFTLRSAADAMNIFKAAKNKTQIISIGGGLLGLEVAFSLLDGHRQVKVIERCSHLLPRQLNEQEGAALQIKLEEKGFSFYLGKICKEIIEDKNRLQILTESNETIKGDLILLSAGVTPRTELAKKAGLKTDRGIIVNHFLQTDNADIYAAGDCIQFGDNLYGYVKSAIEQGKVVGENILNNNQKQYTGTQINPVLKISGIDLKTSC